MADPLQLLVGAVADAVAARLSRLALPLSPGIALHVGPAQGDTDLGLTVASLCAWAQRGELGDWTDHEDAADALLTATEGPPDAAPLDRGTRQRQRVPPTAPQPQATTPRAHARNAAKQGVREKSDGRRRKSTAGA